MYTFGIEFKLMELPLDTIMKSIYEENKEEINDITYTNFLEIT